MNPQLRNGLIIGGGVITALAAGWQIANESLLLTGGVAGMLLIWFLSRLTRVRADALVAGVVLAGYLIGNRGFAQLSVPLLPLLPGEIALGTGLLVGLWTAARKRVLPFRPDALNGVLLAWLVFGSVRWLFDLRTYGLIALRDFAILYYALFFFLAQSWWSEPAQRRWIERCLTFGFAMGAPTFLAFSYWPDFFVRHFSVFGTPLIFVKSDVQAGLLVAGTFWFLHRYVVSRKSGWLLLAATNLLGVGLANSRAAVIAFGAATLWLVVRRNWALLRPLSAIVALGAFTLLIAPLVKRSPWNESLAYRFLESAASITDIRGTRTYRVAILGDKSDNNLFRLTWWRAVVDETWTEHRWFGLGFGYDLASQFTRIYYAESTEDFSARSPHNFPLTVFGRTGLVGLALLLAVLGVMFARTWRAGRLATQTAARGESFVMWVGAWGIFVSACFGVVLEGPMGAAVFWTLLGLANASLDPDPAEEAATDHAEPVDGRVLLTA